MAGLAAEHAMVSGLAPQRRRNITYAETAEVEDRLASTLARRICLQHPCTAAGSGRPPTAASPVPCRHRNHRRDVEHLRLLIEALDITGNLAHLEDYQTHTTIHGLVNNEIPVWK
jgi:hypothetical protein